MLETFSDFCPRVRKLLELAPDGEVLEWNLRLHPPLPRWVDNAVALVGDASHSTLPHLAQGAAQAIEDGAVLGVILSKLTDKSQIPAVLRVYQRIRKPRTDWAVAMAAENGRGLHVGQGDEQKRRDEVFKAQKGHGTNPDKALDKSTQ